MTQREHVIMIVRIAYYIILAAGIAYIMACTALPPETYIDSDGACRYASDGDFCVEHE